MSARSRVSAGSIGTAGDTFQPQPSSRAAARPVPSSARPPPPALPSGSPAGRTRPFLKIQDGCEHHCAYCIVPQVRGARRSLPPGEVAAALEKLAATDAVMLGMKSGTTWERASRRAHEVLGRMTAGNGSLVRIGAAFVEEPVTVYNGGPSPFDYERIYYVGGAAGTSDTIQINIGDFGAASVNLRR